MKRLLWIGLAVLTLLLGLLGGLAWLTATADGFRWLTREASSLSQGKLRIEGVEGHLLTPQLGVRYLEFSSETTRIRVEHARLDWRARALLQRRLDIRQLTAQRIEVTTLKPSAEPATLPANLRLPFGLELGPARVDLARLDIREGEQTVSLTDIRLGVDGRKQRWQVQLDSLVSPWASVRGQAGMDQNAPFALSGHLAADTIEPLPVSAALDLSGRLEAIQFRLSAQTTGSPASPAPRDLSLLAQGEIAPFAELLLPQLLLAGQGIDPAQWVEGAPSARLAFSGIFQQLPGKRLLGSFSLENALAGTLDSGRMPLASLSGAVLGDARHADFSMLEIDLGAAGQLSGEGQWRDGRFVLNLNSDRLNLAGLHSSLYVSHIRTTLKLDGDAERQRLHAEVDGNYGKGQFVLTHDADKLALQALDLSGKHGGQLSAQGSVQLSGKQAFAAKFDLARINPARFGAFPQARLNARGQVSGALKPGFSIKAGFELPLGELEGHPVAGKGRLNFAGGRLFDTEMDVNLAGNTVQLRGDFAPSKVQANWQIHAPALERLARLGTRYLGFDLAGQLDSEGRVSGSAARPQINMQANARGLRLPGGVMADSLNLQLDMQATATGAFNGKLTGQGLALGEYRASSIRLDVQGWRSAHAIELDARLPEWQVTAQAQGGLDDKQVWRGRLLQAEIDGAWPLRLLAPASLSLGQDVQRIDDVAFSFAGGRVSLDRFERRAGLLATRGSFARLPIAPLLDLLEEQLPLRTDLRVVGEWDIQLDNALDGHVVLHRESGGVTLTDPALALGLTQLDIELRAVANQLSARVDIDTAETGRIHAEGRTRLTLEDGKLMWLRTAPLNWSAQARLPDLRAVRPFLPPGIKADAQLAFDLSGSGTLAQPVLDGTLAASGIRFTMPEEGLAIRDGVLKLKLDNNTVSVSEGVLEGQTGRILLTGAASWRNPEGGLTLKAEKFAVLTRSDRRLWLSGTTRLGYAAGRLTLEGDLRADKARIEMPEASRPRLSDDVVVVGQPPRADARAHRTPLDMDLRFDLGDDFLFKGAGIDARLGGKIRVFTLNEALRGEGSIKVEKGRYSAYGQKLDIERGVLTFTGPIGNPTLDILAVRKTGDVTAGVKVSGNVERPLAKLYSDPAMSDTETLSWLVFGHGLEEGDSAKFGALQLMAGALLSQAESVSLQSELAEFLSIDNFEVRGGDNPEDISTTVVSVGKRINSKLMMNYEQSLDGLEQIVKAIYQFSPKFRVEVTTGSNTGLDVFYTLEYD
ncbi:translocation/assembly module TamB domain-containing protein [Thiobacillus sp.]|uniref:translocation/assembly module TamB domain-containing protein n=1 Tax=Thiobacillus sp. TaxID=924 RepID=UPI0025CE9FEA|nr:translocation/assembly module TamB domain-containing protein [Thiobacillus sp.]